ncbi:hypothetical protein BBI15_15135 [Planococcus plakortidis]|uniref:HNH endonuclease n=1 Tax=Planococcus plakortidis TaxID=1038856 RepID=A0A1C7EDE1_9BACL|nr:hypothetical protein [Planococcus plakortidis]ANU21417.1 hypothetical protein BBI15_15135 [Planococcus plakortidis]
MHIATCKLCNKESELQLSHIVPKFIGKWLKQTSAAGYMRNIVNPNIRIQDLPKEYLLCKSCELKFSVWEKRFVEEIFHPYQNDVKRKFEYKSWLKKFVVSLNWRIGISRFNRNFDANHDKYPILDNTLEEWRKFLNEETKEPGHAEHHILFIGMTNLDDFGKVATNGFNHFINMRILRSVDLATYIDSKNRLFIYTCIAGIAFVSQISPYRFEGWTNQTRIKKIGSTQTIQKNADFIFAEFISERMAIMNYLIEEKTSLKQGEIINNGVLNNLEKTLNSKSLGIMNKLGKPT